MVVITVCNAEQYRPQGRGWVRLVQETFPSLERIHHHIPSALRSHTRRKGDEKSKERMPHTALTQTQRTPNQIKIFYTADKTRHLAYAENNSPIHKQ